MSSKETIKICIYYNITENPWGGGNSFLKAFKKYILSERADKFIVVDTIKDYYDILLVNGGHKDQGVYIDIKEISRAKNGSFFKKLLGKTSPKMLYRLDGARSNYTKTAVSAMDRLQYQALGLADFTIFQSQDCLTTFQQIGYQGTRHVIIHNGVDQGMFNTNGKSFWNKEGKLKIFSANWSSNIHKGYSVIADVSEHEEVESYFVGNWPENVDKKNVTTLPPMKQQALAEYYKSCDVFLHAAQNDPCPNVVLEALSCGLPVLYHNSGGTPEIASEYGMALPDTVDQHTIASTIDRLASEYNPLVAKIMRDHHRFSINRVADQYLSIIENLLSLK